MSKQKKLYRISITTDGEKEWYDEPNTRKKIFEEQWWRVYADYAEDAGNKLIYNFSSKSGSIEKTLIVDDKDHIIVIEVEEYKNNEQQTQR